MEILSLVEKSKNKSIDAMEALIVQFMPLINKYTRIMKYDEDFKSDMVLKFIELIQNDLPIESLKKSNDGAIVKYIATSMKNHYIHLSKKKTDLLNCECLTYDNEEIRPSITENEEANSFILKAIIESALTTTEARYINMIFYQGYTSEEVASVFGISKQAVNQCKNRALKKLRRSFI